MLFNVDVEEETSSSRSFFSFASKTFFFIRLFLIFDPDVTEFSPHQKRWRKREREEKRNSQIIQHEKLPKMTPKIAQKFAKRMFGISKKGKAIFVHSAACQKFFLHLSSFLDANLDTDPYFCLFFRRGCNFYSRMRARVDPFSLRKKAPNHLVAKLQRSRK